MVKLVILVACPNEETALPRQFLDLGRRIAELAQKRVQEDDGTGPFTDAICFFRPDTSLGRTTIGTLTAGISSTATWYPAQMVRLHELEEPSLDNIRGATSKILDSDKIALVVAEPAYLVAWINHFLTLQGTGPDVRYLLADGQTAISIGSPCGKIELLTDR